MNLLPSEVTAEITVLTGAGRRLNVGAIVKGTGKSSDASKIDNAKQLAADPSSAANAFKAVNSYKFQLVETEQTLAPKTTVSVEIKETAADASQAETLANTLEQNLNDKKAEIQQAAGATATVVETPEVVQQPTPAPTKAPTFMPTMLPQGASFAPTRMPTYMPTKMPTGMPTAMPTNMPTNEPTKMPTKMPTAAPTKDPTKEPTKMPTAEPTKDPTKMPTKMPTAMPTPVAPTSAPTMSPTNASEEESGA